MHVVVVGAGPGGLAAAINLAGLGLQVTVVEKDALPGGRMRGLTFGEGGAYAVDTGPSILQLPEVLARIFERSGKALADYVTLTRLDPNTRIHFWDGSALDTSSDPARMEAQAEALRPGLGAAMRAVDADVGAESTRWLMRSSSARQPRRSATTLPWRLLPALRFKPWQSLYSHLDGHFHEDRLTYALAYPSKYLGLHPTTCSSVFSVIPYLELAFGVWHVQGGLRALARGMQRCAEDLGARFRLSTPVERVWIEAGQARGVLLEGGERLAADAVVVNADLPYAAPRLIDERWRAGTRLSNAALDKATYSCSTFMLYLGLDKVWDELPHHLIYLSEAVRRTDVDALEDRTVDLDDPPFYVCNPSVTDRSGAPAGHSALYVLVPTPNTARPVDWAQYREGAGRAHPGLAGQGRLSRRRSPHPRAAQLHGGDVAG